MLETKCSVGERDHKWIDASTTHFSVRTFSTIVSIHTETHVPSELFYGRN